MFRSMHILPEAAAAKVVHRQAIHNKSKERKSEE
jgi:hypothetical protein